MHIIIAGLSHKTAPVEIREKVTFPEQVQSDALQTLKGYKSINEAAILSTCNRMEIYIVAADLEKGKDNIVQFICDYHGLSRDKLENYLYFHDGKHAIHHLFRVASSLDSMVLGEAQIMGQVKTAYNCAFEADATSAVLNRLFRHALLSGKRVRSETAIGESAVSVSYAAVELAKKVFDSLEGRAVMLIGAGEMIELTATHLISNGINKVMVTNRTFERAESLAEKYKGDVVNFSEFVDHMHGADIVISCTGAPHYVVTKSHISKVMQKRRNKPIFFIDIAVPRDIDPAASKLYNVFAYDIDDLDSVVQSNIEERKKAAGIGETIVDVEVKNFSAWLSSLEVSPTIVTLRRQAEEIRQKEVEKHLRRLPDLSDSEINTINALSVAIMNKLLHKPIVKLKECSNREDGYLHIESLRYLYEIEDEEDVDLENESETTSTNKAGLIELRSKAIND